LVDLRRQLLCFLLNIRRRSARADCVILKCNRCPEDRHDAVAGEFVHRAPVALDDRRRKLDEFGHDLAQPLRTDRGRDIHRAHDVGEQHSHLFELGAAVARGQWGAARVAESGTLARCVGATGRTHTSHCSDPALPTNPANLIGSA
jgi:hypothetical protein